MTSQDRGLSSLDSLTNDVVAALKGAGHNASKRGGGASREVTTG